MKWFKSSVFVLLSVVVFLLLDSRVGSLPPLGKFLNPFAGFWVNGTAADNLMADAVVPGLEEQVTILWDDLGVPHIFAANAHDLYLAQGYVTARDRLWQLDFQPRVAAGRVSEVVGERALEFDRFRRRIGMVYGAERTLEEILADPESREAMTAFAAGATAWIAQLDGKHLPVEYKLLDYRPEPFTPFKTALLSMFFRYELTFAGNDLALTRSRAALGKEATEKVYPLYPRLNEPVIPRGTQWPFRGQVIETPTREYVSNDLTAADVPAPRTEDGTNGSNNWALAANRTVSGYPLLGFDPHLRLSLPSIWYQVQLVAPGVNVYGISPPGTPGVVFGFNEHLAWGGTGAVSDFLDWYDEEFRGDALAEYRHNGQWHATTRRIEEIHVRGAPTVRDTVIYTHHGPLVYRRGEKPFDPQVPPGRTMRWIGLEPSNELRAILRMSRAKNFDEFSEAVATFLCPELNIAYADIHGDIAIWHAGRYPLRWRGQGRLILDGSDPAYNWQGWIPQAQVPQVRNPARGFVSSCNQYPTDDSYPYYLGWSYANVDRIARVNERLAELNDATPTDMMDLQNDVLNVHARMVLPVLLALVENDSLTLEERGSLSSLRMWKYEHHANSIAANIFTHWWWWLYHETWDDEVRTDNGSIAWPSRDVTKLLITNEPTSLFFDDKKTDRVETLRDIALASFKKAHAQLTERLGPFGEQWAVGRGRGTDFPHLARIPGFGRHVETSGTNTTVNATGLTHGPTFRMVVSLEPHVRAWGVVPGGQSGHPGSRNYDRFLEDWASGRMHELVFLTSPDAKHPRIVGKTILHGGNR